MVKNALYRFCALEQCKRVTSLIVFMLIGCGVAAGNIAVTVHLAIYWTVLANVLTLYLLLNYLSALFYLELYDPGYVVAQSDAGFVEMCAKCQFTRPARAHHCSVCGKCVRKFDHHCDVFNYCIGAWTLPYFFKFFAAAVFFLFYSAVLNLLVALLTDNAYKFVAYIMIFAAVVLTCIATFAACSLAWKPVFRDLTQLEEMGRDESNRQTNAAKKSLGRLWGLGLLIIGWKFSGTD